MEMMEMSTGEKRGKKIKTFRDHTEGKGDWKSSGSWQKIAALIKEFSRKGTEVVIFESKKAYILEKKGS